MPTYNSSRADAATNALYMRAKGHFHSISEKKFTDLCKKRLKNFSKEHPVKVIAKADEDIITDVTMKVFDTYINPQYGLEIKVCISAYRLTGAFCYYQQK